MPSTLTAVLLVALPLTITAFCQFDIAYKTSSGSSFCVKEDDMSELTLMLPGTQNRDEETCTLCECDAEYGLSCCAYGMALTGSMNIPDNCRIAPVGACDYEILKKDSDEPCFEQTPIDEQMSSK